MSFDHKTGKQHTVGKYGLNVQLLAGKMLGNLHHMHHFFVAFSKPNVNSARDVKCKSSFLQHVPLNVLLLVGATEVCVTDEAQLVEIMQTGLAQRAVSGKCGGAEHGGRYMLCNTTRIEQCKEADCH